PPPSPRRSGAATRSGSNWSWPPRATSGPASACSSATRPGRRPSPPRAARAATSTRRPRAIPRRADDGALRLPSSSANRPPQLVTHSSSPADRHPLAVVLADPVDQLVVRVEAGLVGPAFHHDLDHRVVPA